jgi:uncharacterized protein
MKQGDSFQLDSVGKQAAGILIQLAQPGKLWLFGSRARKEHRPGSDYDLALEDPGLKPAERWRVTEALERLPTLKHFDVVWLDTASEALREEVSKEGVCLYER